MIIANFFMVVLCCNSNDFEFMLMIQISIESKTKTITSACEKQSYFSNKKQLHLDHLQLVIINDLSSAKNNVFR